LEETDCETISCSALINQAYFLNLISVDLNRWKI
jgi:hypothetical protein